jgi:hypothetical protein
VRRTVLCESLEGRGTGDAPGRPHETLLTAGQPAGAINEILPVAEIMRRLVPEIEAALSRAVDFRETAAPGARCTGTPTRSFRRPKSGPTTVFAVEQMRLLATRALWGVIW